MRIALALMTREPGHLRDGWSLRDGTSMWDGGATGRQAIPARAGTEWIRVRSTASIMEIAPIFRRNAVPLGQNRMQCGAAYARRGARLKKIPVHGS